MVAALALAGVVSAAEWYVNYEQGKEALEAGRFGDAVQLLESAIAARSEPSNRARTYGMHYIEYYPYFYLGKAFAGLGNSAKAREMFETSQRLNELAKAPALAAEVSKLLEESRTAQVTTTTPPPTTIAPPKVTPTEIPTEEKERIEKAIASAKALSLQGKPTQARSDLESVRRSLPQSPAADTYRTEVEQAIAAAREQENQANTELQAGLGALSQKDFREARRRLGRTLELDQTRTEARQALDRLEAEERANASGERLTQVLAEARGALVQGNLDLARQKLDEARKVSPQSPDVGSLAADLRRAELQAKVDGLFEEGQRLYAQKRYEEASQKFAAVLRDEPNHPAAGDWMKRATEQISASMSTRERQELLRARLEELRQLVKTQQIGAAMEKLRSAQALDPTSKDVVDVGQAFLQAAKEKARQAVMLHFQGRYAEAISSLEDALVALSDRAGAHLYLAWACYARYLADGEADPALAEKARSEMREALRLEPHIQADPRVVSPRLVSVLEQVRSERP